VFTTDRGCDNLIYHIKIKQHNMGTLLMQNY